MGIKDATSQDYERKMRVRARKEHDKGYTLDMGVQDSAALLSCCLAMDAAISDAWSHWDPDGSSATGKEQTSLFFFFFLICKFLFIYLFFFYFLN